jgi:CcmD family protein
MNPGEAVGYMHLVIAYGVVFAAIFTYLWLMGSRQKRLEKKIESLREELKDSTRR